MTERLGIKRKLNARQKLKLAKHAWIKFIDPKLRDKEKKAQRIMLDAIIAAADAIPAAELKVLRKHDLTKEFKSIHLPWRMRIVTGQKEFTVGETKVMRDESELVNAPAEWDSYSPISLHAATTGFEEGYKAFNRRNKHSILPFGRTIELPAIAYYNGNDANKHLVCNEPTEEKKPLAFHHSTFMTPKIVSTMSAYYLAANVRAHGEATLAMTACKLISASSHYQQILEFWPEAAEIEGDLFEDRLPSAVSLVTISDEDKALLCRNMRSRGVKGSDLCKVAA